MDKTTNSGWNRGESIGKGSFGTVSVGFDRQLGRVFAVKSVEVNSGTEAQVEAIENEIHLLRPLSSPFIVKYYGDDVTNEKTAVYRNLHMEYLPGGTAADLSKSSAGDAVAEEIVRRCTKSLVSALQYVHSKGIVHCDVKGKNVLLGFTPGTAKLADFGSAKMEDDRTAIRGSPLWMAPEVVRGESQGSAADVWAMGCTVIEMVTGAPAWRDEGANTLYRIGYSDELPRFPTRLSAEGVDFLEKCLRKEPSRRWSCDQLLQHPFLSNESTVEIKDWSSPRSVIGWMEVSDHEEEGGDEFTGSCSSSGVERIGKLGGSGGANWESDGWVEVRGLSANEEVEIDSGIREMMGAKEKFQLPTRATSEASCSGEKVEEGVSFTALEAQFCLLVLMENYSVYHHHYCIAQMICAIILRISHIFSCHSHFEYTNFRKEYKS